MPKNRIQPSLGPPELPDGFPPLAAPSHRRAGRFASRVRSMPLHESFHPTIRSTSSGRSIVDFDVCVRIDPGAPGESRKPSDASDGSEHRRPAEGRGAARIRHPSGHAHLDGRRTGQRLLHRDDPSSGSPGAGTSPYFHFLNTASAFVLTISSDYSYYCRHVDDCKSGDADGGTGMCEAGECPPSGEASKPVGDGGGVANDVGALDVWP